MPANPTRTDETESAGDAVLLLDGEGRVVSANAAAARLFGWPAEELAGRPAATLIGDPATRPPGKARGLRRDGTVLSLGLGLGWIEDPAGRRLQVAVLRRPCPTEAERARALAEAEDRLRLTLDWTGMGMWDAILDAEGDAVWSKETFRLLGYPPTPDGRVKAALWEARVHPEDLPRVQAMTWAALGAATANEWRRFTNEYRVRHPDGTELRLQDTGQVRRLPDGRLRAVGVLRDITEEHAARTALAAAEERLRLALEAAQDGIWDWDIPTGKVQLTRRLMDMIGYGLDELPHHVGAWEPLIHPEDNPAVQRALAENMEGRSEIYQAEYRIRHRDGHWVWLLDRGRVVARDAEGRPLRMVGTHSDITRRKQVEEALEASEARLRLALEATGAGLWDWDVAGRRTRVDARWSTLLGHDPGEGDRPAEEWRALMHPEDAPRAVARLARHMAGETPSAEAEYRIRHRDGHWVWLHDHGRVVERDAEGRPRRMVGLYRDISARKAAEQAQAASETRLRALLATVPECVKVVGPDGRMISINQAGRRMMGLTPDQDPRGMLVADVLAEEDRAAWSAMHARVCQGEEGVMEYTLLGPPGRRLRLETRAVPIRLEDGSLGQLAVTRDVTGRREAEAQLAKLRAEAMQASRVSAVGAMAAGLAHELNQPLGAIANYAAAARLLLQRQPEEVQQQTRRVRDALGEVASEAVRAGDIVRRLRDFVGRAEGELSSIPARRLLEEAQRAALATLPGVAPAILVEAEPAAGHVFGDPVQIGQVLGNLIRNAAEALRGRPAARILLCAVRAGGGGAVEFSVADNGPGLDPRIAARLFEPFASTKSGGMGIGLAICRTIVEAHGGRIWVDAPRPGGGTVFRFTIPDAESVVPE